MEHIINNIINSMLDNKLIEVSKKELYTYHMTIILERLVTYFVILLFSIQFKVFIHTIFFLCFFANIRKHSGGFHLRHFYSCFISSVSIYIMFVKIIYPFLAKYNKMNLLFLLMALVIILYIGSMNNPNINWSIQEFEKNKQMTRYIGSIETFMILGGNIIKMETSYLIYMTFGIFLSAILLLIEKISDKINFLTIQN